MGPRPYFRTWKKTAAVAPDKPGCDVPFCHLLESLASQGLHLTTPPTWVRVKMQQMPHGQQLHWATHTVGPQHLLDGGGVRPPAFTIRVCRETIPGEVSPA